MPPRGNVTPSSAATVRSGRQNLRFPLEQVGKASENCYIDALDKRTTPVGATLDDSDHSRSMAFAAISPAQAPTRKRSATHSRCPCLHGQPHLPTSPTCCPPFFLFPAPDERMQQPQQRHSSPVGRMQHPQSAVRLPSEGCNTRTAPFVSQLMDAPTAATPFISLHPPPPCHVVHCSNARQPKMHL